MRIRIRKDSELHEIREECTYRLMSPFGIKGNNQMAIDLTSTHSLELEYAQLILSKTEMRQLIMDFLRSEGNDV